MNKPLPDIRIYLAERALKEYYRSRRQTAKLEEIANFCCREEASLNLYKTYLRLQRQHIDRIVVGMVLENLNDDMQKFAKYHYRDNRSYYMITHQIPYSSRALGRINKRILTEIHMLLFYSLSVEDVFYQTKVINMIHILDLRIMAMMARKDLVVNKKWLKKLMEKRKKYRKLLDIMQDCLDIPEEEQEIQGKETTLLDTLQNKVVATKLQHPNYNVSEISQTTGISKPTVSRKLRQYMTAAYAYIQ